MKIFKTESKFIILLLLTLMLSVQAKWSSEWVYYNGEGKLEYKAHDNGDIIPDFSGVGYKKGETPPDVEVVKTLEPEAGDGDDYERIQNAINEVGNMPLKANGFRGALLLKKGVYRVSKGLIINKSGVVLKGEGNDDVNEDNATVIIASAAERYVVISIKSGDSYYPTEDTRVKITDDRVPVGAKQFTVESADKYSEGDEIMIFRPGTAEWIHDIKMDQLPGDAVQWKPEEYNTKFERKIVKISGNTITIDQPIVMAIETKYGGGEIYKYTTNSIRHSNCAVENMLIKSIFDSTVIKQKNGEDYYADEKHARVAVGVYGASVDCWVRDVTAKHFSFAAVNIGGKYISVLNCKYLEPVSIITGGRRYAFGVYGQMGLVKNCYADKARHSYVTGPRRSGPNVITRSTATNDGESGPHQRWAMGFLYDLVITNSVLNAQDRQGSGSGHGWSGVNHIIWNCDAKSFAVNSPWGTAYNYVIGSRGKKGKLVNKDAPPAIWDGLNETSSPEDLEIVSLYEAQRKDNDVTPIVAQSKKTIVKKSSCSISLVNKSLILNYLNLDKSAKVKIFTPAGRMVKTVSLNGANKVSLKSLNHGLYLVKFTVDGISETKKLLLK